MVRLLLGSVILVQPNAGLTQHFLCASLLRLLRCYNFVAVAQSVKARLNSRKFHIVMSILV